MTTTVNKTVKSAGGDYSTLSAWEAAQQGDLTAADEIRQAECFGFLDNTATVTVDGWTTDATRYIRIYATAGAQATMPYTSSGYRLERTASSDTFINAEDYLRVEGLTFKATNNGGSNSWACYNTNNAGDVRYTNCVVQVPLNSATAGGVVCRHAGTGGKVSFINCVAYTTGTPGAGGGLAAFSKTSDTSTLVAYNCLAYRCLLAFNGNSSTGLFKNCIYDAAGVTPSAVFSNADSACDYNASTEAGTPGTHSRSSQTFTFVDAAGGDFHLDGADGGALGFGTDLSADATYPFSTDFDGETISGAWNIGPDWIASGATVTGDSSDGVTLGDSAAGAVAAPPIAVSAADGLVIGDEVTQLAISFDIPDEGLILGDAAVAQVLVPGHVSGQARDDLLLGDAAPNPHLLLILELDAEDGVKLGDRARTVPHGAMSPALATGGIALGNLGIGL